MTRNIAMIAGAAVAAFLLAFFLPGMIGGGDEADPVAEPDQAASVERQRETQDSAEQTEAPAASRPARQPGSADPALALELAEAARQVNAAGPTPIDPVTTMVGAEANGIVLEYRYQLTRPIPADQIDRARQSMGQSIAAQVCSSPDVRPYIDRGAALRYAYYAADGRFLFRTPPIAC